MPIAPSPFFPLRKQCRAYAKFQWEHVENFTIDFLENGLTSSSFLGFHL